MTSFTVLGGQQTGDFFLVLRNCFVFDLFNKDKPISEYRVSLLRPGIEERCSACDSVLLTAHYNKALWVVKYAFSSWLGVWTKAGRGPSAVRHSPGFELWEEGGSPSCQQHCWQMDWGCMMPVSVVVVVHWHTASDWSAGLCRHVRSPIYTGPRRRIILFSPAILSLGRCFSIHLSIRIG